jgi:predicted Fe-S protein YdhL (DUF1289 family)
MPKPPKLSMAAAARVARDHDPNAWDAMTALQRRELIRQVNERHADEHRTKAKRTDDARAADAYIARSLRTPSRKR